MPEFSEFTFSHPVAQQNGHKIGPNPRFLDTPRDHSVGSISHYIVLYP